jgi:hypothetical protein
MLTLTKETSTDLKWIDFINFLLIKYMIIIIDYFTYTVKFRGYKKTTKTGCFCGFDRFE